MPAMAAAPDGAGRRRSSSPRAPHPTPAGRRPHRPRPRPHRRVHRRRRGRPHRPRRGPDPPRGRRAQAADLAPRPPGAHPAPGRYAVRLVPPTGGRFGVFAEMERAGDGGHQVARTAFAVAGPAARRRCRRRARASAKDHRCAGRRRPRRRRRPPDAGVGDFHAGRRARVTDLQGWLGMGRPPRAARPRRRRGSRPDRPRVGVRPRARHDPARAGRHLQPQVAFDHTFARPGRHALWIQVQRDWRIVTVPRDRRRRAGAGSAVSRP